MFAWPWMFLAKKVRWACYHAAWGTISEAVLLQFPSPNKRHRSKHPLRITSHMSPNRKPTASWSQVFTKSWNGNRIWIFHGNSFSPFSYLLSLYFHWIHISFINWADRESEKEGFLEAYSQPICTPGLDLWLTLKLTSPSLASSKMLSPIL